MLEDKRCGVDRRSEKDRRRAYDLDYFFNGGTERRDWIERRSKAERRLGWMRVANWASSPLRPLEHQM